MTTAEACTDQLCRVRILQYTITSPDGARQAECPADFAHLRVLDPPVGDFLFYPIWLARSHEAQREVLLRRLAAMSSADLGCRIPRLHLG